MFDRLIAVLKKGATNDGFGDEDIASAVTALYFHMIAVDGVLTPEEMHGFRDLLHQQFGFESDVLDAAVERGIEELKDSQSIFPFTSILNREFSDEQKIAMIDHLNHLAHVDGEFHPLEVDLIDHVGRLLHLE